MIIHPDMYIIQKINTKQISVEPKNWHDHSTKEEPTYSGQQFTFIPLKMRCNFKYNLPLIMVTFCLIYI